MTILLASGGTGGHIFPAESLAQALLTQNIPVALMTDKRFHHYNEAAKQGVFGSIPLYQIHAGNLSGNLMQKIKGGIALLRGVLQARRIIKRIKPSAVVGFGGYPSFPTLLAATMLKVPTIVHEQNSVLGRTNRWLSKRVSHIATTYETTRLLPDACKSKVVWVGNPVRAAVLALRALPYVAPEQDGILRVLITGGSQGAHVFSTVVPEAVKLLPEALRVRLRIEQQCRVDVMDATRTAYAAMGIQADLAPFFSDIPQRLASAHLVIGRAGASTVAELACAGRPALLVPYPSAMDNHQYYNAQSVADANAGWVMVQDGFTPQALAARLEMLLLTPETLTQTAANMRSLGKPDAAEALARLVMSV